MNNSLTLLGLLSREPSYGYDLKHSYDRYFGAGKALAFGQVYSTLARMVRDELIRALGEESGGGPDRKKYEITVAGQDRVREWLFTPDVPSESLQSELFAKTVIALLLNDDADRLLDVQRGEHMARMRELTRMKKDADLLRVLMCDHGLFHIEADLRWLSRLAAITETESPELRSFHPQEVVRQFTQSLRRELDFAGECRNAERIAENFAGYSDMDVPSAEASAAMAETAPEPQPALPVILIPRVHWHWTGERVCVQEFIDGISGRKLKAVDQAGLDRKILARRGAHAVLKMIVEDGFFHADPHPGNVFYLPGNRIAFIDFGMIGRLTEERRDQLIRLLLGLVQHEPQRVADVMLDWTGDGAVDEAGLMLEIQTFVDQYHGVALKQLRLGAMLSDLMAIVRQHQLALPADLSLLIKAFISLEGMGRELDPDFDMAGDAMPLLEQALRARYTPAALIKRGWQAAGEALALIADLPHDLSQLLRAARRGRLEIRIDVTHLKRVGNQLDSAANRLVVGIVVAALIIGSSIVMTVPGGPSLLGLPFFGLLGFLSAAAGGMWLLLSIWKSSRADRE